MAVAPEKMAAIAVVGNEVLAGDVDDHNGAWLSRELYRIGVPVGLIITLPDDEELLAGELRRIAERYAPVLVTGGIGTTLDDVTRQAVARAAGVAIELRRDVVAHLEGIIGRSLTPIQRRLAELPARARLIPNRIGRAPGFIVGPYYVFPGVPEMLRDMFPFDAGELRRTPFLSRVLFTSHFESEIAALLEELARRAPDVAIGSYPKTEGERHFVQIVLKSKDDAALEDAAAWLAERLPGQPSA